MRNFAAKNITRRVAIEIDIDIRRQPGEQPFEYHRRLINGKLDDKSLREYSYSELSEGAFGRVYSDDVARRMFYGSRYTLKLLEEYDTELTADPALSELDKKIVEVKKEQQKLSDQRTAYTKLIRERSRQEELNDIIKEAVRKGNLPRLDYQSPCCEPSSKDLLISLNDIHYGLCVENAWNVYSPEVCMEMMRRYLDKIIEIAELHHAENCIVYNCGDTISGNIHLTIQIKNKENAVEQVKGASELIAEFLMELSRRFNTVRYVSVSGNHSRLTKKDDALIDERLDDLVEWYLEARLQNFENIIIDTKSRLDPTMFVIDVRGKTYCGVHGDFDGTATKIAALQNMVPGKLYAVLCGHKHHNACDHVQGIKIMMTGSFLGMDDYCVQKRIVGDPEQMVCVCDETGVVCQYDIPL